MAKRKSDEEREAEKHYTPDLSAENEARAAGFSAVCGIDEAGRGPLAGPVVAAAVILPPDFELAGLTDSKKLTAAKREKLFAALMQDARVQKSIASATAAEIDELNILRATHLAMARAAHGLASPPADFALIDGLPVPNFPLPSKSIVKGDSRSLSIAAASILAKVTRDHRMQELDALYPAYGFAKHAGYGTAAHLAALRAHGPCPEHRRSFAPVAQLLPQAELPLEF
ncbi:MAG: ribonuclease HII [Akkermansia sp.]|nr:ribonuclease HII [Akkermansia sp.]